MTEFHGIRATGIDTSLTVVHEAKRPPRAQGRGDVMETFTFFVTLSEPAEDEWQLAFQKRWKDEGRGGHAQFTENGCIGILSSLTQMEDDLRNVQRCVAAANDDYRRHLEKVAAEEKRKEALKASVAALAERTKFI